MAKRNTNPMEQAVQDALESVERIEQESEAAALERAEEDDLGEPEVIVEEPAAIEPSGSAGTQDGSQDPSGQADHEALTPEERTSSLNDQLLRLAADFENYRKRARREQEELRKYGIEQVVRVMLPVLDNLQRAKEHADKSDPIVQGVEMVTKQFIDALATYGVRPFDSLGQAFDPGCHEAVGQVPTGEVPAGAVFQEMEKGYTLHDRLLRPAKVLVAVEPQESDGAMESDEE